MTKRATLGLGLALSLFALLPAAAVGGKVSSAAVALKVYRDPAGDGKGGPDFKSLSISDARGMIKLVLDVSVKTPAAGAPLPFAETFFDPNG